MRLGLISLWLRAAIHDVERRSVAIKYAVGLLVAMGGWTTLLFVDFWPLWIWFSMALVELLVPVWAESKKETPWHAGHIAERYGLLTIIVIGESVLSATTAVQVAINEELVSQSYLLQTIIGGLLIMLSIWWLYFSSPSERFLKSNKDAFRWGYGHFFIFMLIAAIGAGIAVNIEQVTGHSSISNLVAGGSVTIPAAVFLLIFWFVQIEPHKSGRWQVILYTLASILVGLATFLTWSILIAGLVFTILVAISIFLSHKKYKLELANN